MKKNNMFKYITTVFVTFFAIVLLFGSNTMIADATELATGPLIVIDKYEVTDEKIVPGEDFTLKLTISNYNETTTATDVLLDIDNPEGVAPVYGTVSQVYLGDIAPGETREIEIDYNSWTSITGDTLDFFVTIVTSVNQNYVTLRIPTGSDSPFSIISSNIPAEISTNERLSVSLAFQVLGNENVRDVAMVVSSDGEVLADSMIGIVTPGVTRTQQLSAYFDEPGEYALDIGLEYVDPAGQKILVPVTTQILAVKDVEIPVIDDVIPDAGNTESDENDSKVLIMGISGILILVIFLIVIIISRKNK